MAMPKNDESSRTDTTRTGTNRRWLAALRGKTLRFTFEEGPTAGTSYDHTFSAEGTVTWQDPAAAKAAKSEDEGSTKEPATKYGSFQVTDDVYVVSYLSKSGYTLTVALNFETDELFGFASNDEHWYPVRGIFEVLE
ncbi:MAG TPA: MoaF N-terminal domain-containing protein [Polyangiaceae bacterium]